MTAVALACGYLLGGLPTADWLALQAGIDLRAEGSHNPGANNARKLGGRRLAAAILIVEVVKGAACVLLGAVLGGQQGMVAAGVGAALGNVANPYRRFRGGQGLGIAAGILAAGLPIGAIVGVVVIGAVVTVVRASAPAALAALASIVAVATWLPFAPWGLTDPVLATVLAVGLTGVIMPKQVGRLSGASRPRPRESA